MTIGLDPGRTAVLVIDMQNGFCHPEGGLAKAGQDNAPQVAVIPAVKGLIRLARGAGIRVAWSKQVHFPENRAREGRAAASHLKKKPKGGSPICARGSRDVEFVDDLAAEVAPDDEVIVKPTSATTISSSSKMAWRAPSSAFTSIRWKRSGCTLERS